jgi:hypothetical protein
LNLVESLLKHFLPTNFELRKCGKHKVQRTIETSPVDVNCASSSM